ncbi:sperm-associated antigen 16 protein [Tachyglossus aculeatus]|uniref:sperm-associated antigen 16 protein n=1 Tax=Tachyglossus aculeatus TaxID=9261 RepID=UPI0018F71FC7|nr:sperm-associated antigen 16 protein [Tachyglossus aculeatus]
MEGRPGWGSPSASPPGTAGQADDALAAEGAYYLHQVTITEPSEDDYKYEEVSIDDDISFQEGDEDLAKAVQMVQEQAEDAQTMTQKTVPPSTQSVSEVPEVIEDFLRNFLIRMGMNRTFESFQNEWYEIIQKGSFQPSDPRLVPDVYTQNQLLEEENKNLKKELEHYKIAANKASKNLLKSKKECDFHRLHHKRVVQEKDKLNNDIKGLKLHYGSYEKTLKLLQEKKDSLLRQKMLTTLEKDKAVGQITGLQATLQNLETGHSVQIPKSRVGHRCERENDSEGPTQEALQRAREGKLQCDGVISHDTAKDPVKQKGKRYPKDSEFPVDTQINPHLYWFKECGHPLKSGYKISNILKVHDLAVSSLALHPHKEILITCSDDHLWKMWAFPSGNLLMTGVGHTDWLSGCCFHPSGTNLATSSGDTTVKIWNFSKGDCILTLEGHSQAIWSCTWHSCGDFVASSSMDNTSKVWDLNSERCRYTLRGHSDSVNSIEFLPFSNTILTSSADKTLSLWDARTGLCAHTFYGHMHSCNDASFNMKGDTIVSCDSCGVMKLWDVRKVIAMVSIDVGPSPGNQVVFDPSGRIVAQASNDGTIHMLDLKSGQLHKLTGHENEVHSVAFTYDAGHLFSGGADGTVRIWS